jgi:hypothetical protein
MLETNNRIIVPQAILGKTLATLLAIFTFKGYDCMKKGYGER